MSRGADLGLLVLRLSGVSLALAHGLPKLSGLLAGETRFIEGVARLGFPYPTLFAWAAALAETVGGLLLALGIGTRVMAAFCAVTMAVAAFARHHAHDQLRIQLGWLQVDAETLRAWGNPELALVYLLAFLALLLAGGGRFALDRMLRRKKVRVRSYSSH